MGLKSDKLLIRIQIFNDDRASPISGVIQGPQPLQLHKPTAVLDAQESIKLYIFAIGQNRQRLFVHSLQGRKRSHQ